MTDKTKTATKTTKVVQTTAEFIKTKIMEGKLEDKQILALARKRAPKQSIGNNYVSWYRWQLKTRNSAPRLKNLPKKKGAKKNAKKAAKKSAPRVAKPVAAEVVAATPAA